MLITTVWLGAIGFADDYIKVFKKNKDGLSGKLKILGQVALGLIVGLTLYLSNDVEIKLKKNKTVQNIEVVANETSETKNALPQFDDPIIKSTKTTIPFVKDNEFDYAWLVSWMGTNLLWMRWVVFVFVVVFRLGGPWERKLCRIKFGGWD